MISEFFKRLPTIDLKQIKNGKEFEKEIGKLMNEIGLIKRNKNEVKYLREIKKEIICDYNPKIELERGLIELEEIYYIYEPYGSQSFPDYLIIKNNKIIPIEIKFSSTATSPMWNGSLPKQHTIYIFASKKLNDLTYFLGRDMISIEEAKELNLIWDELNSFLDNLKNNKQIINQFGFDVYLRKTFYQRKKDKTTILNYFKNSKREQLEKNVIEFINNL
jgi:hypothetical protein